MRVEGMRTVAPGGDWMTSTEFRFKEQGEKNRQIPIKANPWFL